MATRENLNKLNVNSVKQLARDLNIEIKGKRKAELIGEIINSQLPPAVLTPVRQRSESELDSLLPLFKENLPPFNKVSYNNNHTLLPKISFSTIYSFMIARSTDAGGTVKNFKGLDKAVKHYDAGDVQNILFAQVDGSTVYVKATCQASMKKVNYQVFICATVQQRGNDTVDYAYCQCPIGLGQSCSHIGGLLFALSNFKVKPTDEVSCTSKLCQWKAPRASCKPQPLSSMNFSKPKIGESELPQTPDAVLQSTFDPRHTEDRGHSYSWIMSRLRELKTIFPNTGMCKLWDIPDSAPEPCHEVEVQTFIHPLHGKMQEMVFSETNFPPVSIDDTLATYIESQTRDQRLCEMWKNLHKGRITSSIFADVLNAGPNPNTQLVKQVLEGSNLEKYASLPPAVQWGIDHEASARIQYRDLKSAIHQNFRIEATGLTLCTLYSFLGASSDGLVTEDDSIGLLEIKCPFSLGGTQINHMQIPDIIAMDNKSFCLENSPEGPKLKYGHKYFTQVQGEMAITSKTWCDFVVWTAAPCNNIVVDRVYFDMDFVSKMLPKLVEFYINHIYPVYAEKFLNGM